MPAAAQVPAALGPEGKVFTLTGGGGERPRDGLPLYRVRGEFPVAAPLPAGDVVLTLRVSGRPWLAGLDGRLHPLPWVRDTGPIAAATDGTVLAVSGDRRVLRLRPDRSGWDEVLDLRAALPASDGDEVSALVAFPGGGFALALDELEVWRVAPGGAPEQVDLPEETEATALAALPAGELAVGVEDSGADSRVMLVPDGGTARPLTTSQDVRYSGLAPGPGGGLIAATGTLDVLDAAGMRIARVGRESGSPAGDGGPAANARLFTLGVAAADDGSVLTSDFLSRGFLHFSTGSEADDLLLGIFGAPGPFRLPIRAFVPPGTARPLAAVAAPTAQTLGEGAVAVESTFAGRATVVVTRRGEEVARAAADIAAGRSAIALPAAPPEGDLTVTAEVLAGAGRVAGGRLEVSTFSRLTRRNARRAIRRTGALIAFTSDDRESTSGCHRTGARRFACRILRGGRARCVGGVIVIQRADGRHIRLVGKRRGC